MTMVIILGGILSGVFTANESASIAVVWAFFVTMFVICTPILLPVVKSLGVDPVHFGMIMMVNLGIGLITPPVGTVLFVGSAVSKLSLLAITRAMKPFFVALIVVLLLVTYVPALSLWLPGLLLK